MDTSPVISRGTDPYYGPTFLSLFRSDAIVCRNGKARWKALLTSTPVIHPQNRNPKISSWEIAPEERARDHSDCCTGKDNLRLTHIISTRLREQSDSAGAEEVGKEHGAWVRNLLGLN